MKKLHPTGFTPGNDGLILSPRKGAKSGGFVLALDDTLVAAIELARRRRDGEELGGAEAGEGGDTGLGRAPGRRRSSLSPREIQARLRAGSTIREVAGQAGVDDEWVIRFAAPILAEQAQVVESAQRLTFAKARRGPSIEPLAPSVQWNLSDRGVRFSDDVFADCWSAYSLHGARWAVRFAYTSRKRRQVAEWEVDLRERSLTARNRHAADLGHVEEGRRRPIVEPPDPGAAEAGPPGTATHPATRAGGRTRTATSAAAKKTVGTGRRAPAAAKKTVGTRRTAASAAKKTVGTGRRAPAAAKKTVGTGRTAASAAAKRPAVATKAGKAAAQPAGRKASSARPSVATGSSRESSSRRARPGKKPAGESPAASPAPDAGYPDRPSHLARPPSPMKAANRAPSYPTQRLTSSYARPAPPPPAPPPTAAPPAPHPPAPPPTAAPRAAPAETSNPAHPRFEPTGEPPGPTAGRPASPPKARPAESRPPAPAAPVSGGDRSRTGPAGVGAPRVPAAGAGRADAVAPGSARGGTGGGAARATVAASTAGEARQTAGPPSPPAIGGRKPPAVRPQPASDDRPAVVILSTPASKRASETGDDEARARLAAADLLRAALASPPQGAHTETATPSGRPGGRPRRPGRSGQGTAAG